MPFPTQTTRMIHQITDLALYKLAEHIDNPTLDLDALIIACAGVFFTDRDTIIKTAQTIRGCQRNDKLFSSQFFTKQAKKVVKIFSEKVTRTYRQSGIENYDDQLTVLSRKVLDF